MENHFGRQYKSQIGQFKPLSWFFWHYRLGVVSAAEKMPEAPLRPCGVNEFVPKEFNQPWHS
jgi:hypothetical protein